MPLLRPHTSLSFQSGKQRRRQRENKKIPAELVNNLRLIEYAAQSIDEGEFQDAMLETIRTCQLIAMQLTIDELEKIRKETEDIL